MNFTLTKEQAKKLQEFEAAQPYQYMGAIGGGLTISFTPNSIGMVVKARHINGNEIDLTEYEDW